MNKNSLRWLRLPHLYIVFGLLVSACTTQSGPTYTAQAVVTSKDQQASAYHVTCSGLFESSKACLNAAKHICGEKPVTPLAYIDGLSTQGNKKDPREMTFMCDKPAPAQLQPQSEPPVKPQPKFEREVLLQGDAYFASDSAELTVPAKAGLDNFVRANKGVSFARITVTGHTDSTGSTKYNEKLSEARATSVVQYLRDRMGQQQFVAQGAAAGDPVASNETAEGRALNRRVQVRAVAQ